MYRILVIVLLLPSAAWGALARDGSGCTGHATTGTSVSCSISTGGTDRMVYAICMSDTDGTHTVSGGGLSWSVIQTEGDGAHGRASVWRAWAASQLTSQSISCSSSGNDFRDIQVIAYSGADSAQTGAASNLAQGTSGAMQCSLTNSQTGSQLIFGAVNYASSTDPTAATNNTKDFTQNTGNGTRHFTTYWTALTSDTGSKTLGATTTSTRWHSVCAEVIPSTSQAGNATLTGQSMTFAQGAAMGSTDQATLTGQSMTFAQGTVTGVGITDTVDTWSIDLGNTNGRVPQGGVFDTYSGGRKDTLVVATIDTNGYLRLHWGLVGQAGTWSSYSTTISGAAPGITIDSAGNIHVVYWYLGAAEVRWVKFTPTRDGTTKAITSWSVGTPTSTGVGTTATWSDPHHTRVTTVRDAAGNERIAWTLPDETASDNIVHHIGISKTLSPASSSDWTVFNTLVQTGGNLDGTEFSAWTAASWIMQRPTSRELLVFGCMGDNHGDLGPFHTMVITSSSADTWSAASPVARGSWRCDSAVHGMIDPTTDDAYYVTADADTDTPSANTNSSVDHLWRWPQGGSPSEVTSVYGSRFGQVNSHNAVAVGSDGQVGLIVVDDATTSPVLANVRRGATWSGWTTYASNSTLGTDNGVGAGNVGSYNNKEAFAFLGQNASDSALRVYVATLLIPATPATATLTGQSMTYAQGTLSASGAAASTLTGQAMTYAQGTVSASGAASSTLTGQAMTYAHGTVSANGGSAGSSTLTGQAMTFAVGAVSAAGAAAVTLAEQAMTFAAGAVSAEAGVLATLTGQAMSFAQGAVEATGAAAVTLTGQHLTFTQGVVSGLDLQGQIDLLKVRVDALEKTVKKLTKGIP